MPAAPNQRVDQVVTFDPDPNGWGIFRAVAGRSLRDLLRGTRPTVDPRGDSYSGWVATPQRFTGLAWLTGATSGRPSVAPASYLVNQRSAEVPGIAAAYDRLRRQT